MNKLNLSLKMNSIIEENKRNGKTPSLLLHCCCAPCSSSVLEQLTPHFNVTAFFYNPNISPLAEYEHRLSELKNFISQQQYKNPVKLLEAQYDPERFFELAKGLENVPEGGERCRRCFLLRLSKTAENAKQGGYDLFTTTLSVSPLKNAQLLYETACTASKEFNITVLPSDFKKNDGYLRSVEFSKQYGLYRQNYCGCVFSNSNIE